MVNGSERNPPTHANIKAPSQTRTRSSWCRTLSYDPVADDIVSIGPERLGAQGVLPEQLDVALDGTDDEATPTYTTDDGREVPRVTRENRPDVRANRHARKVAVTAFGWENVRRYATIRSVAHDRGLIDGKPVRAIEHEGTPSCARGGIHGRETTPLECTSTPECMVSQFESAESWALLTVEDPDLAVFGNFRGPSRACPEPGFVNADEPAVTGS